MESDNNTTSPDISVILPALNEETTIGICIGKIQQVFRSMGIRGEVIVSDSSTDATAEIAQSMGAIIVHPEHRGYGYAYLEAFRHARGRYIVIGDADNTYDFLELPLLIRKLDEGADIVIGSRFKGEILEGAMIPLHRYIGNPLLTWVLNKVFGTDFSDTHSGFRAIRADSLKRLNLQSWGMEFASEMLIKASREGLIITEVPITYHPRGTPSKLSSYSDGWRHLRFILLLRPMPFLTIPGILCTLFGLVLMAAFYTSANDPDGRTHSFILGTILLTGGFQLLLSGVVIRVYSAVHGFERREGLVEKLLNYQTLEKLLVAGSVLVLAGLIIGGYILWGWMEAGFGSLNQIRNAVLSLSLVIIGLEIGFIAVFISMMCLNGDNPS
ncbi:MAG TPA: glycosyltransferase family 2 protein [Methanoregulaceae archaeon]|nr:glycosyltransferase family 2 protein [Methanoregulaceae archaeon]HPA08662.1 glycosyltransferase family 2 protein [Methanoregulaceae archaeon]HPS23618.1 glycosyltransferase family 2 protein [Methanoregulaceae archaeon]HQN89988.1 glycosyltransferase family 2 protein [Methanoregulaceae archaeon]